MVKYRVEWILRIFWFFFYFSGQNLENYEKVEFWDLSINLKFPKIHPKNDFHDFSVISNFELE